ncbi:MAG: hypothetical protein ACRDP7_45925 [Trebonia sp.]
MRCPVSAWRQRRQAHSRALADAATTALAGGAQPNQVIRAVMTCASLSSPDPDDFEHRTAAYGIARQAVYSATARPATAPAKEEP